MYRLPLTCPIPATATLPTPRQLAALGPVLCVYRGRLLEGWRAAAGATHGVCVDADGVCEYVLLRDAGGRVCWRLYLLPDSDFLAWERLVSALPEAARTDVDGSGGLRTRLWRQLTDHVMGASWRSRVLRLAVYQADSLSVPRLAAHPAGVSTAGFAMAQRLARRAGARQGGPDADAPLHPAWPAAGPHHRLHASLT